MSRKKVFSPGERGVKLIHNPVLNKGTAFTEEERKIFGLRGLLPSRVVDQNLQVQRVIGNVRSKPNDLERYLFLTSLQDRNENLFYRVVMEYLDEIMPIIYTPTVGQACQLFGHIYRRPRGLYINIQDKGHIRDILLNWPHRQARVIVVTDGERILGLGDLGADGMGIPIGKLSLYTACAGIDPTLCLPILLDVGTENEGRRKDPFYLGLQQPRVRGAAYEAFLDEFVEAANEVFPGVLIQLEDFATENAFNLLKKYREQTCLFNDDIQGTASVALAGILSALRITRKELQEQKVLFLGAGEAGVGIADIFVSALVDQGIGEAEARQKCWLMDSKGLVCASRWDLAPHKLEYAHDHPFIEGFHNAVDQLKPTAIIGVSGQPHQFNERVIRTMCSYLERPIVFALSNPTSKSECTAEQAYRWSEGRAIFASGSPFEPVILNNRTLVPGQGNNVYIFPGLGLGAIYSEARHITDRMFLIAAQIVSETVTEAELGQSRVYPSFERIREVSSKIAAAVAREAVEQGLSQKELPDNLIEDIQTYMYDPEYPHYI